MITDEFEKAVDAAAIKHYDNAAGVCSDLDFKAGVDWLIDHIKENPPNPKIKLKWKHKKKGNIVKVVPWMEIPDPVVELKAEESIKAGLSDVERKIKFGTLIQVGWMIENANGVFIGVGLSASEEFEEVNE